MMKYHILRDLLKSNVPVCWHSNERGWMMAAVFVK